MFCTRIKKLTIIFKVIFCWSKSAAKVWRFNIFRDDRRQLMARPHGDQLIFKSSFLCFRDEVTREVEGYLANSTRAAEFDRFACQTKQFVSRPWNRYRMLQRVQSIMGAGAAVLGQTRWSAKIRSSKPKNRTPVEVAAKHYGTRRSCWKKLGYPEKKPQLLGHPEQKPP